MTSTAFDDQFAPEPNSGKASAPEPCIPCAGKGFWWERHYIGGLRATKRACRYCKGTGTITNGKAK